MRLQCGCQWGAAFISRLEDTLPRWLMPMAVGWRPQLLSVWPSPQSCLSVLTTWQPGPKVSSLRKRRARRKLQCFYDPVSKLHHYFHFTVSVRSESLNPFHRQGKKELNATSWMEEYHFVDMFKPPNPPQACLNHKGDLLASVWTEVLHKPSPGKGSGDWTLYYSDSPSICFSSLFALIIFACWSLFFPKAERTSPHAEQNNHWHSA